jgi:hypothetical protein
MARPGYSVRMSHRSVQQTGERPFSCKQISNPIQSSPIQSGLEKSWVFFYYVGREMGNKVKKIGEKWDKEMNESQTNRRKELKDQESAIQILQLFSYSCPFLTIDPLFFKRPHSPRANQTGLIFYCSSPRSMYFIFICFSEMIVIHHQRGLTCTMKNHYLD